MTDNLRMGEIVLKEPEQLTPFETNAKLHPKSQIDALAQSIRDIGFRNKPIEIMADGTIVNGHGRWMASMEVGLPKVPCVILDDMTDIEIRKYRISDNKIADTGFDNELLKGEVMLLSAEGEDFSNLFSEKDMDFLIGDLSEMNLDAITSDLAEDVDELSQATQGSIDDEDNAAVAMIKVLGYSKCLESEQRGIARLQAHAEGVTGLQGSAALSAYAKDHAGL